MRSVILYITYMYMYIHVCTYFDFPPSPLPPPSLRRSISPANEYSLCSHASGTPFRSHTAARSSLLFSYHDLSGIDVFS